ncbi:Plant organelle RNA recognition domain [Dillenia turbinata]|uniref:Plant organelle RNA recognition domain n=1 Tax=Dillenia turbinata TaxID=194707 RepID=A0AAN8Z621_9MAGN
MALTTTWKSKRRSEKSSNSKPSFSLDPTKPCQSPYSTLSLAVTASSNSKPALHIFEVYEHPVCRILFLRFTLKAEGADNAVDLIRLEHVRIARQEFGLPEDFKYSVILKYPQFFRLLDANETGINTLRL